MKPTIRLHRIFSSAGLLAALLAPLGHLSSHALTIDATQSAIAGGFHLDFTIDNPGPDDFAIITLNAPAGDPLIAASLTTAPGFLASYDAFLGLVDFLEEASAFLAGTTTSGFGFDTLAEPPAFFTQFSALTIDGETVTGRVNFRIVPDAGNLMLPAIFGLAALAFVQPRNRSGNLS